MPALVCPSPLGELVAGLPGPNHQFEVERGQDQQETIHGEATRLQFELGDPCLAGSTGLHTQLLLAQIPLPSCSPEERSQLFRDADHPLACGHGLLDFPINASYQDFC